MSERRTRRRRTRRGESPASSNLFSRLVPNVIEKPITTVAGGAAGLVGNLASDVTDSVVGLPMGLVNLAKHPIRSTKAIGTQMAHTWSPLFTGHPVKFLQQTYDHPLAPILDVATVFTLGAGSAVRGAKALSAAGMVEEGGKLSKLATLTDSGVRVIKPPPGEVGLDYAKPLSNRAGRRLVQETMMKIDEAGHLPQWYKSASWQRMKLAKMAHGALTTQAIKQLGVRQAAAVEKMIAEGDTAGLEARLSPDQLEYVANRLQAHTVLNAGDLVTRADELGRRARAVIPAHMHANLARHATQITDVGKVEEMLAKKRLPGSRGRGKRHFGVVYDPAWLDTKFHQMLGKEERRHAALARSNSNKNLRADMEIQRLQERAAKYQHDAKDVPRLEKEASDVANEITRMREQGHIATAGTEMAGEWPDLLRGYRKEIRLKRVGAKRYEDAVNRIEELKQAKAAREGQIAESFSRIESFRNRSAQAYFDYAAESYDTLLPAVEHLAQRAVGHDLSKAMRGPNGEFYVVPLHDAYNLSYEGGNSLRFLHTLIHKPTVMWKKAVLLYTPRIISNNGVGNWFLYTVRNPNPAGMRALYHTLRDRYGDGFDTVFPTDHWLYRWFGDEMLADSFHQGADVGLAGDISTLGKTPGQFLKQGFAGIQYQLAEKPVRAASIRAALYRMPEVKAELQRLQKAGHSGPKALDQAIENVMKARPDLRDAAAFESRRLAGDYVTLSEGEKFARDIIPFYLWQRHIIKTTGNMFLDQPATLAIGSRLSQMGIDDLRNQLGDLPDFLRGVVPLAALGFGDHPGRANVLLTSSLNPFATVGDMADAVEAWTTGGQRKGAALTGLGISPFLTVPIEQITGTSLLTGAPNGADGGVGGGTLSQIIENLPYVKTLDALTGEKTKTSPSGKDYLYAHDVRGPASWLTGFTVKDMSLEAAAALAAKEQKASGSSVRRRRRTRTRR